MTTETTQQQLPTPSAPARDPDETLPDTFGAVLAAAVTLLRDLPRGRADVDGARERVAAWAAQGAGNLASGTTLVVDEPPGQPEVGYDLLLDLPGGGTVGLTLQTDDGVPWTVDHATHWAAGYLVTIDDDFHVSVPDGLLALRSAGRSQPSLLAQLIDQRLVLRELAQGVDADPLTTAEVQAAMDAYRRRLGLLSADRTHAWLAELGLPWKTFEAHIANLAFAARFRRRLAERLGPAYLVEHPEEFVLVRAVWARCARPEDAQRLAAVAPGELLTAAFDLAAAGGRVECGSLTGPVEDLPAALREALPDNETQRAVGPVSDDGRFLVGAVLAAGPMPPGPELNAAAGRAAAAQWFRERRAAADIQWHWL